MNGRRVSGIGQTLMRRLLSLCLIMLVNLSCAVSGFGSQDGFSAMQFNVGYRVIDLKYQIGEQEKILTVALWYPTVAQPKAYNYGGPTSGNVALDAEPSAERAPYPFLIFSHGYGGSGLSSVFFTEPLASRGWIVAAPDHNDTHSAVRIRTGHNDNFDGPHFVQRAKQIASSGPEGRSAYLYRLKEMKLVLDQILTSESFGKLIDRGRIAVGGHSLGGFTALGLCGTIEHWFDDRIKAVLLFSTGAGGYLFRESELAAVRMPSMYFLGEREKGQLRGTKTMAELADKVYQNLSPPKYFLEIKGANHFSFNNRFTNNRMARLLSGSEDQFEVIRQYSTAFLEKHVAGKKEVSKVLEQPDSLLSRYVREPAVSTKQD